MTKNLVLTLLLFSNVAMAQVDEAQISRSRQVSEQNSNIVNECKELLQNQLRIIEGSKNFSKYSEQLERKIKKTHITANAEEFREKKTLERGDNHLTFEWKNSKTSIYINPESWESFDRKNMLILVYFGSKLVGDTEGSIKISSEESEALEKLLIGQ